MAVFHSPRIARRIIVLSSVFCVIGALLKKKPTLKVGFNYYSLFRTEVFCHRHRRGPGIMYPCSFSPWSINTISSTSGCAFSSAAIPSGAATSTQNFDAAAARFFQQVDGRDNGTTSCQHWVNDQRHTLIDVRNQFLEVRYRLSVLSFQLHCRTTLMHALKHF